MRATATLTKGDSGAPMDSVEGKRSSVSGGDQMTLSGGGESFGEWEQGEELTRGGKSKGAPGFFVDAEMGKGKEAGARHITY
jgi:hypothetical protein